MKYKGWTIEKEHYPTRLSRYYAMHDNYDAEFAEGRWVDNGLLVYGLTIEETKQNIDDRMEELDLKE